MLIRRPPVAMPQEAQTVDELREIVREIWARLVRLEDELAGRKVDRDDEDSA